MQNTSANHNLADAAQKAADAVKGSPAANAAANAVGSYGHKAADAVASASGKASAMASDLSARASDAIAGAGDKAAAMAGDLSARTADAASDAMHSASKMASDAGARIGEIAEGQRNAGADALSYAATKARGVADQMHDHAPQISATVRDAADGVERVSKHLRETSLNDMAESLSDAAKGRPLATLAAAFVAGIVLTRLMSA